MRPQSLSSRSWPSDRPTVLLVEDIHWAEPDLLDLLERLVADARAPVMLVATARPEILDLRPTWGAGKRNATVLWLDPLSVGAVSQLLDEKLPELTGELRDLLVQRADGNPFFLEELMGELLDSGVLVESDDGWAVARDRGDLAMPDTVHAVLAARIDRLPEIEKAALQAGAVMGRVFSRSGVVHLLGGDEPDFGLLEERDLVVVRSLSGLRARTASSRSSMRSRARLPTARFRRRAAAGFTPRSPTGSRGKLGRARSGARIPLRRGREGGGRGPRVGGRAR